jgi:pimeloyl-ACP methyl ester carboxylesterase
MQVLPSPHDSGVPRRPAIDPSKIKGQYRDPTSVEQNIEVEMLLSAETFVPELPESRLIMPFATSTHGVRIHYEVAGSGDPPIVLVHGWCCDLTFFAPQIEHFSRNHRVVAVDLRGHGQSDKPEQEYTIAGFADELMTFCRGMGLMKPIIMGHSMGAMIAAELTHWHPELPLALILLDGMIVGPQTLRDTVQHHLDTLHGGDYREAQRAFVADAMFLPTSDQELRDRIAERMASAPQHVMISALEGILRWDGEAAAQTCSGPALNLSAAHPANDLARLQELCPQWVMGQTVGAGHFHQLEVPEQVNAMVERFLTIIAHEAALV